MIGRIGPFLTPPVGATADGGLWFCDPAWGWQNTGAYLTVTPNSSAKALTVGDGTGTWAVVINGGASSSRDISFRSAGVVRWLVRCESTAEAGADAGSAFNIIARDDAGAQIDVPFAITRASGGTMTLRRPTSFTDTTDSSSTGTGSIHTAGGLGVIKAAFIGGLANIAGVLTAANTTEASAVGTAGIVGQGGLGIVKRSFLGTIGSTFKGNVIAGVQDATAATAGATGEVLSSVVSAVAVASTGTVGNITSLSITAGHWMVYAFATIAGGATGLTSGSTAQISIVTTTATNGTAGSTMAQQTVHSLVANGLTALCVLPVPVNISSTTTYYLTEQVTFGGGSPAASGTLVAVRIR